MEEKARMNLATLQQGDPYISVIIDVAVNVVLYKYSNQFTTWSPTGIEGSLFVYQRSASPQYGLMILNQKDLNNFWLPLTKQLEFHLNTPFLLFKLEGRADSKEDENIAFQGIWFQERGECLRLTEKLQEILLKVSGRRDKKTNESGSKLESKQNLHGGSGPNIVQMLEKAQNEYKQVYGRSGEHTVPSTIKHPSGDATGSEKITVGDLFRMAKQSSTGGGVKMKDGTGSLHQHLLTSTSKTQTVEELERQHLGELESVQGNIGSKSPRPGLGNAGKQLLDILNGKCEGDSGGSNSEGDKAKNTMLQDSKFDCLFRPVSLPDNNPFVKTPKKMPPPTYKEQTPVLTGLTPKKTLTFGSSLIDVPSSGSESLTRKTKNKEFKSQPAILKPCDLDPSLASKSTALLTPQNFANGTCQTTSAETFTFCPSTSDSSTDNQPLTREQLQQTMIHLLTNDSEFLNSIHSAYLQRFYKP